MKVDNMKVDMVAAMKVDMVVDMEVVMVADIVAHMVAEVYPTCVSSKLCEFILEERDFISSSAQTFLLRNEISTVFVTVIGFTFVYVIVIVFVHI